MTVIGYDQATSTITHQCPVCAQKHGYVVSPGMIAQHRPDRGGWSLALGPCPGCGSSHHLNLNLPDDHPDPAAGYINQMLRQQLVAALPPATVPAASAPPPVAKGPDHQEHQQTGA